MYIVPEINKILIYLIAYRQTWTYAVYHPAERLFSRHLTNNLRKSLRQVGHLAKRSTTQTTTGRIFFVGDFTAVQFAVFIVVIVVACAIELEILIAF